MFCSVHVPSFVGGEVIYVCEQIEEEETEVQAMHGVTVYIYYGIYQVCNLGVNKNCHFWEIVSKSCQVWQSQRYIMDTDIVKIMYKLGKYQECMGNAQLQSLGRVY